MEKTEENITIHFITHGKHLSGDNTAETYDGPLTEEAKEQLKNIKIPSYEKAFCGWMLRHSETASVLGIHHCGMTASVGFDENMFSALDFNDNTVVEKFLVFIEDRKKEGLKEILIITSRLFPILMKYIERGGEEKFGPFGAFCKIVDDMPGWGDGTIVPLMESGKLTTFTF